MANVKSILWMGFIGRLGQTSTAFSCIYCVDTLGKVVIGCLSGDTCRREAGLLGSSGCRSTLLLLLHIILVRYPELCLLMRLVFGTFLRALHGPAHNRRETLTCYPSIGDSVNGLIS